MPSCAPSAQISCTREAGSTSSCNHITQVCGRTASELKCGRNHAYESAHNLHCKRVPPIISNHKLQLHRQAIKMREPSFVD